MEISLEELNRLEVTQLMMEHETSDPDPNIWRWSPLEIKEFDIMLHVAYEYYRQTDSHSPGAISFCEAGSGIGTKLYLAKNKYGMTEYGYEINEGYITVARELDVQCEQRDLADMDDQPAWAAFDIVYVARPFKDDLFEAKWEKSVQDAMRPGALFMAAFVARKPYSWPCIYRRTYRGIWVKPNPDQPIDRDYVMAAISRRLETSSARG